MSFWRKKVSIKELLPPPVKVAHGEYSMILSAHDAPAPPTPELIQTSLRAIQAASSIELDFLDERAPHKLHNVWPGEHYKLLAGFMKVLEPKLVVEIGTSTGLSALSMLPFFEGKLVTFDIKSWESYPDTALSKADFESGRLQQIVGDLTQPLFFAQHESILQQAEFIFIDATHDGQLEKCLLQRFASVGFHRSPLILFDDIRVWTMLKMWREINYPKLDLTSFGHWSGTGVISLEKHFT